jgi:hypothetical protein
MLFIDEVGGTQIILLLNESMTCLGKHEQDVEIRSTPETGPILASVRTDRSGKLWLGGWRRAIHPVAKGHVSLAPEVCHCDWLCRRAASSTSVNVTKAHNELGQVPIIPHLEFLVTGRRMPTFIIPARWRRTRGKGHKQEILDVPSEVE